METASLTSVTASGILQQSILQQGQLALQLIAASAPVAMSSAAELAASSAPTISGDSVGGVVDVYA